MFPALLVIFAGILHATWNALAKAVPDRYAAFAVIGLSQSVLCLPGLFIAARPAAASLPYIVASILIHLVYMFLLIRSYDLGDFSQVYPLARGSAPLVVAGFAATFLGEHLSVTQLCGVAAVCGGLSALSLAGKATSLPSRPAVTAALLTGASIAAYTIVDGLGVRRSESSAGYTTWMFVVEGVLAALGALALRGRPVLTAIRAHWYISAIGGALSMLSYGIVLWAQTRSTLAEVAALRETGVIWGAIFGVVFFAESMGPRRIAAAGVVAVGVVLLTAH
jgi:drug/metabolite transporter (DMT)-like permease